MIWNRLPFNPEPFLFNFGVMEQPDYKSFTEYFHSDGRSTYFAIHPEMYPAGEGISPTGSFFIFCIHPIHGSCTFVIEQDDHCTWLSENLPPFVDRGVVRWIGERIESKHL